MRRRLATLVLLLALVVGGAKLLDAWQSGPVPVQIRYRLGEPRPRALEVQVLPRAGGPPIAHFETNLVAADPVQHTRLPSGLHRLEITTENAQGARRTSWRTIEARRDAVIEVDLRREPM